MYAFVSGDCSTTAGSRTQGNQSSHLLLFILMTIFPGVPVLAGIRMSSFWIILELRMTEVVVTVRAIRCAKLQSTTPSFFTSLMPFLSLNQQCPSTEGKSITLHGPQAHPGVFQPCNKPCINQNSCQTSVVSNFPKIKSNSILSQRKLHPDPEFYLNKHPIHFCTS